MFTDKSVDYFYPFRKLSWHDFSNLADVSKIIAYEFIINSNLNNIYEKLTLHGEEKSDKHTANIYRIKICVHRVSLKYHSVAIEDKCIQSKQIFLSFHFVDICIVLWSTEIFH